MLSNLSKRVSQVFSGNQGLHGDGIIEQNQAIGMSDSYVARPITSFQHINMPGGIEAIFGRDTADELQGRETNTVVAGKSGAKNDVNHPASETKEGNVIGSHLYDDEEWVNRLRREEIEAGSYILLGVTGVN